MIKNLLRILASSVTFVAVMLVANIAMPKAIAFPQVDNVSQPTSLSVSLNVISPSLESYQSNNSLLDHLGCSCATCTQGA